MMLSFAALVLAAVLSKVLGNQIFTPLSVAVAAGLLLLRMVLDGRQRRALEIFLLQFGLLIYALANQDPSYHEHAALLLCLLPSLARLRQIGRALLTEGSILVVMLYLLWSVVWSSNLDMSTAGLVMSALCMAFLVAYVLYFQGDWDAVFRHVLIVLAAVMVGSFVAGGMGHGSAGRTFAGVTLHRNQLGFLLGLMILLCLFVLRSRWRWLHLAGGVTAAGLLIFIDSKSAIIAIAFTALVFLLASARRRKLYLGLLALAMAVFVATLPSPKMDHFALWMGRDPTFTSRTEIWAGSLGLASQQPFTGYGYNAVWSAHENRVAQFPDAPGPRYAHAHNAWIDWVLQLGIGGLAVYLLMLGVLFMRAYARGQSANGLPVAIQASCLVLYIQIYDLANVSTVPITRFGFFMLGAATLSLWLTAAGPLREQLTRSAPPRNNSVWNGPQDESTARSARPRWWHVMGLTLIGALAMTTYAVWEDGRRFAATQKTGTPAPSGVAAASYLEAPEFQWKGEQALADYARRHREALQERLRRSEVP